MMMKKTQVSSSFKFLILTFSCIFVTTESVWLNLKHKQTKCVSEELHTNLVVLGDYVVVSDDHFHPFPYVSIRVNTPFGKTIYEHFNVTHGQFAFTTTEAGSYIACFWAEGETGAADLSVNLDWKTGVGAKDLEAVARKEHFEGLELELAKLELAVGGIHENLIYLRNREEEMRAVSEITNSRVAWYSIMSLGICIGVAFLQILYLKQYFHKKKLI